MCLYQHFLSPRDSYPVLVACLEEVKALYINGTSDQKSKAEKAEHILNCIYNVKFALTLAVLCDVYRIYSEISVALQKVSTLPHTRYDQFIELVEEYRDMLEHVDIKLCPCSTYRDISAGDYSIPEKHQEEAALVCSWPTFHKDVCTLQETGKIVHVIQGQLVADPLRDTRVGRKEKNNIKLLNKEDIIDGVQQRATDIVKHLSSRLEEKVYRKEDIAIINSTRIVLGAHNLINSLAARGAPAVSSLTWDKFLRSSVMLDPDLMERVPEEEYRLQFKEYLRRLENLAKAPNRKDLKDMELLELFLEPKNQHLYSDIEGVISVMVRGSLLISVESVVESWISVMEHHASQRRTLGEMQLHEEMVIAVNGPSLVHCDSLAQVTQYNTKMNYSYTVYFLTGTPLIL